MSGRRCKRMTLHGRTPSDVELVECIVIDRSASGRSRPGAVIRLSRLRPFNTVSLSNVSYPAGGTITVRSITMLAFFSPTESISSPCSNTEVTPTTIAGSVFVYKPEKIKMSRSADYTIQGFLYQFNQTLSELLKATDDAVITIEGIVEDIEVATFAGTKAIQCKYHETQK